MIKYKDAELLKSFMDEFFPFDEFLDAGIFTPDIELDYDKQADIICNHFGFDSIYEYGAIECTVHLSGKDFPSVYRIENVYK